MFYNLENGELYTFGKGKYGVLGHDDYVATRYRPNLVKYFIENNLKIKDVAVGTHHTIALTG